MSRTKITYRYSPAFKQKVVSEIESGQFTIAQARRIYDIYGTSTIQSWISKHGKNHLLSKVVRIEMKNEKDKVKELKRQIKTLESALAQERLRSICFEALIETAEEELGVDLKKTLAKMHQKSHNQSRKKTSKAQYNQNLPSFGSFAPSIL